MSLSLSNIHIILLQFIIAAEILSVNSQVLVKPPEQVQYVGESVTMSCSVNKSTWTKDGDPLPGDIVMEGNVLVIDAVTLQHSGVYTCTSTQGEQGSGQSQLYVGDAVESENTITPKISKTTLEKSATFTCQASGNVKWFFEKKQIPRNAYERYNPRKDERALFIRHVSKLNAGYYYCYFGDRVSKAELIVGDQTKIYPTISYKKVGENAKFKCSAHNRDQITWTFNDGPLPSNAQESGIELRITSLTLDNEGFYECIGIFNEPPRLPRFFAVGSLNFSEPPRIDWSGIPKFFTSIYNQIFTFVCTHLNEILHWVWRFNGGGLPGNVGTGLIDAWRSEMMVKKPRRYNSGIYTCMGYSGDKLVYQRSMNLEVIASCSTPQFKQGHIQVDTVEVGGTALYRCKSGFTLEGNIQRQCLSTGEWSGKKPNCIKASSSSNWINNKSVFVPLCFICSTLFS